MKYLDDDADSSGIPRLEESLSTNNDSSTFAMSFATLTVSPPYHSARSVFHSSTLHTPPVESPPEIATPELPFSTPANQQATPSHCSSPQKNTDNHHNTTLSPPRHPATRQDRRKTAAWMSPSATPSRTPEVLDTSLGGKDDHGAGVIRRAGLTTLPTFQDFQKQNIGCLDLFADDDDDEEEEETQDRYPYLPSIDTSSDEEEQGARNRRQNADFEEHSPFASPVMSPREETIKTKPIPFLPFIPDLMED